MSKKKTKETIHLEFSTLDAMKSQRRTWGNLDPRSRIVESKKTYKRHPKHKNRSED